MIAVANIFGFGISPSRNNLISEDADNAAEIFNTLSKGTNSAAKIHLANDELLGGGKNVGKLSDDMLNNKPKLNIPKPQQGSLDNALTLGKKYGNNPFDPSRNAFQQKIVDPLSSKPLTTEKILHTPTSPTNLTPPKIDLTKMSHPGAIVPKQPESLLAQGGNAIKGAAGKAYNFVSTPAKFGNTEIGFNTPLGAVPNTLAKTAQIGLNTGKSVYDAGVEKYDSMRHAVNTAVDDTKHWWNNTTPANTPLGVMKNGAIPQADMGRASRNAALMRGGFYDSVETDTGKLTKMADGTPIGQPGLSKYAKPAALAGAGLLAGRYLLPKQQQPRY